MRVHQLLAVLGSVIFAGALAASTQETSKKNFTNIRERLPQMVAELGAMAYEESSEEASRPAADVVARTSPKQQFKRLASAEEGVEYKIYQGVMGRPGVDFPVLPSIPRTDFTCKKVKNSGYYADLDTDCQVFHICDQGRKISFLCPNGTIFRQSHLICDWWWTVDCESSVDLYESSAEQLAKDQQAYKARSDQITIDYASKRADRVVSNQVTPSPQARNNAFPTTALPTTTTTTQSPQNQDNDPSRRRGKQLAFNGRQQNDAQTSTTTYRPRGTSNYSNIRVNYGPTGGMEQQVPAESASFVNNKNQFGNARQNQFIQPAFVNQPSITQTSSQVPFASSQASNADSNANKTPSSNQASVAEQPSFRNRARGDEDGFSNRGRGPPTKDFYKSTSTEVVPITDAVEPAGRPFKNEDDAQKSVNGNDLPTTTDLPTSTLAVALSNKVKPVYIQVTTREGRLLTSTTTTSTTTSTTTDAPSSASNAYDELASALATLGPHVNIQYATTTEHADDKSAQPVADVNNSYSQEVKAPSIEELPPFTGAGQDRLENGIAFSEPSITELPPFEDQTQQNTTPSGGGAQESETVIPENVTTERFEPIVVADSTEVPASNGDSALYIKQSVIDDANTPPLPSKEFPPIFDISRPSGVQFTSEDEFANQVNKGLESASLINGNAKPRQSTTFVEFDRVSKELKFVTTEEPPAQDDVKTRASELHSALDDIVHGKSSIEKLKETLAASADERQRTPFVDVQARTATNSPVSSSTFASRGPPMRFQPNYNSILSNSQSATADFEPIATTLLPPELYNNDISFTNRNSLEVENSRRDPISVNAATENSLQEQATRVNGDRTGLEIPTSSGPAVLHSLAVYFGDKTELNATEPTPVVTDAQSGDAQNGDAQNGDAQNGEDELLQRAFSTNPEPSVGIQHIDTSGAAPALLTQFTKDSYEALFPETRQEESTATPGNATGEILQRQQSSGIGSGNDLTDTNAEFDAKKAADSADLRELAQVFSRALSAYLEDPEEFRKVLSEVRPTAPSDHTTPSAFINTQSNTTPLFTDREEDEVLEYSDDLKIHKRPIIQKVYSKQELDKKPFVKPVERKGRILTVSSIDVAPQEAVTVPSQYNADLGEPTRHPLETLEKSPSAYYNSDTGRKSGNGNHIAAEIPTAFKGDATLADYGLPPGTQQYKGPGYGPQPGDVGFRSAVQENVPSTLVALNYETTTTVKPYETTTEVPTTTVSQENNEQTTYVAVNQYDGYIIPVLDTDLTPPFAQEIPQLNEAVVSNNADLFFQPQDLNNLAVVNTSEEQQTTTEPQPTTTEEVRETTTLLEQTTTLPEVTTTPFVPETTPSTTTTSTTTTRPPTTTRTTTRPPTTTRAATRPPTTPRTTTTSTTTTTRANPGQTVRFNVKEDRTGRRVSFSRNAETGETLVRANSASFQTSRYEKESANQWNAVNRFESNREVKFTDASGTTTSAPTTTSTSTRRPGARRRFKTTPSDVADSPLTAEEILLANQRFAETHFPSTPAPARGPGLIERKYQSTPPPQRAPGLIERRHQSTSQRTPISTTPYVLSSTTETKPVTHHPTFQRRKQTKSDKIVYGTKVSGGRKNKQATQKPTEVPETTTEVPQTSAFPQTYLPEPTTTETPQKMPMEMEAKMMFGDLNETSINQLMDVMKMAESNSTVRRLVLLLVNHGAYNKSTEESRRNLIEALLTIPDDAQIPESLVAESTAHVAEPISKFQQYNDTTSMKISMTVGTSSKTTTRRGKTLIGTSVKMSTNEGPSNSIDGRDSTTTQVPITTYRNNGKRVVYKPTVPTTTKRSAKKPVSAPPAVAAASTAGVTSTTMRITVSTGATTIGKRTQKKLSSDQTVPSESALIEESDNRAVDLLRSLYSLAARWG